nr:retropepsin-like aspartic protease [Chroococcidiopsis sp. [FACHB-1243]]
MLVDTGASYTTLPTRPLESLGYSTAQATRTLRLISASGMMNAPVVSVCWFNCLGIRVEDYPVISYTLPTSSFVDGILGMDFLAGYEATIATATAEIHLPL